MKLAKSILGGIAAFGIAGAALAAETPQVNSEPIWVYEESYVMLEPQMIHGQESWSDSVSFYSVYEVDDDMDGRTDRLLVIPESDTLG